MRIIPDNDWQTLDDLMPELRRQHRSTDAPAPLELVLRAAAESKAAPGSLAGLRRSRNRTLAWGMVAAAVVLVSTLILAGVNEWGPHREHRAPSGSALQANLPSAPTRSPEAQIDPAILSSPIRAASAKLPPRRRPPTPSSSNFQQAWQPEFVALPASEGLPKATAISLVRMRIQQGSLQQYGLEVPAESTAQTLLAEFMVGEDGLPRAVRILP